MDAKGGAEILLSTADVKVDWKCWHRRSNLERSSMAAPEQKREQDYLQHAILRRDTQCVVHGRCSESTDDASLPAVRLRP